MEWITISFQPKNFEDKIQNEFFAEYNNTMIQIAEYGFMELLRSDIPKSENNTVLIVTPDGYRYYRKGIS